MEFEWDSSKEADNLKKHGFTFTEAVEAILDKNGFALSDNKHSIKEPRHYWVGKIASGKVLTVRYTKRGGKIRIFGCAEWRKFKEYYNERTKTKKS